MSACANLESSACGVVSDGFDKNLNIQFPRAIREEGSRYVVESLTPTADGSFYRANGTIKLLLAPGQQRRTSSSAPRPSRNLQAAKAPKTANDLETTNDIGDCVLVQCVQKKPESSAPASCPMALTPT